MGKTVTNTWMGGKWALNLSVWLVKAHWCAIKIEQSDATVG